MSRVDTEALLALLAELEARAKVEPPPSAVHAHLAQLFRRYGAEIREARCGRAA